MHAVVRALRAACRRWGEPVVERIGKRRRDPFRVLISCVLSLRTKDEVTGAASSRLFARATTPQQTLSLDAARIRRLIYPVGFYRTKAKRIRQICQHLIGRFRGRVPESMEDLLSLPGVGRKTANLVQAVGFGRPAICVDVHVHRISNRLGYVQTRNPLETEMALREKLPRRYWISYNTLMVRFGQKLCRPVSPWCSRCPIRRCCARVGVTQSR
ncbi:MAG: endonuclease III [Candidatus Omnitrophica bacterium]|nr:endonuclease III [Candidatus Omnitrophota bacterium]